MVPASRVASLQLVARADDGRFVATVARLDSLTRASGRTLLFAMNAGMYEADTTAVGLLITEGRAWRALNREAGPPDPCSTANFFCPPNGVFTVDGRGARVMSTGDYVAEFARASPPRLATQSGPMLVQRGALARAFNPTSVNRRTRNGVGVRPDGAVVFVLATEVTFFELASAFREELGCSDALYLDGGVSQVYTGSGPLPPSLYPFASLFALTR